MCLRCWAKSKFQKQHILSALGRDTFLTGHNQPEGVDCSLVRMTQKAWSIPGTKNAKVRRQLMRNSQPMPLTRATDTGGKIRAKMRATSLLKFPIFVVNFRRID